MSGAAEPCPRCGLLAPPGGHECRDDAAAEARRRAARLVQLLGVGHVGDLPALARRAERAWLRAARTAERTPALRRRRRDSRAGAALDALRAAIFLRTLADDYAGEDPNLLVTRAEEPELLLARWDEAASRTWRAFREGATAPGRQREAVGVGAR